MFASLNKVGSLESTGFRNLGHLKQYVFYHGAENIPTLFGEKVRLDFEDFGRILLPERFKHIVTKY